MSPAARRALAAVTIVVWLAVFLAYLLWAAPVAAQSPVCAPHARVITGLSQGFGEVPVAMALGANTAVIEVLANAQTGSWTIIVTSLAGATCVVASGQSFELIPPPLPGVPG